MVYDIVILITTFFVIITINFIIDNNNINFKDYINMWKDLFKTLFYLILFFALLYVILTVFENIIKTINPPCSVYIPPALIYQCEAGNQKSCYKIEALYNMQCNKK